MSSLLAIETSSEACSVALSVDARCLTRDHRQPRKHAELLLPTIRELLLEGGVALHDLDGIAFGRGPGSFTSLRIGIGVVQGLAWGAELGVIPVSSLAAVAQGIADRDDVSRQAVIVAAMDARMGEVFHARYQVGRSGCVEQLSEEAVAPPETVDLPADGQVVCAGNGFERYPELLAKVPGGAQVYTQAWPCAVDVVSLARHWLEDNQALPAHQAQPVYVRDNVAKKSADQG